MSSPAAPTSPPVAQTGNWWDQFVAAAEAKLEVLKEDAIEVFDAIEPVVVQEFDQAISDLESIALNVLSTQAIAVLTGQEKISQAAVQIAYQVQDQGKQAVMADIQQAASNAADALSVAKAKILGAPTS